MTGRLYAVKVALDPSPAQARLLASHAGAAKFAYNRMLHEIKTTMEARHWERVLLGGALTEQQGWSLAALRRTWNVNKDVWAPWWQECSKEAFNHGLDALACSLENWAASKSGARSGPKMGFPRFRGRRAKRSFSYTTGSFRPNADGVSVQLPRIGRVHCHEHLDGLLGKLAAGDVTVKRATVSFSQGRWWCSFTIVNTRTIAPTAKRHQVVGVDVGLVDLLVAATPEGGEVLRVPAPRALRDAQHRLAQLQRKSARQMKFSNRWHVTQRRIVKVHARAANLRRDAIHKATSQLATTCETVVVEDLNVRGMGAKKRGAGARGRGFNRAVADAALGEVTRQLTYKTGWNGGTVIFADRWFPSTKTCSGCGNRKPKLLLSERQYDCPSCGLSIDRDLNAAVNLAHLAVCDPCREWPGERGRGANQKPGRPCGVTAGGCETSTHQHQQVRESGTAASQEVAA